MNYAHNKMSNKFEKEANSQSPISVNSSDKILIVYLYADFSSLFSNLSFSIKGCVFESTFKETIK